MVMASGEAMAELGSLIMCWSAGGIYRKGAEVRSFLNGEWQNISWRLSRGTRYLFISRGYCEWVDWLLFLLKRLQPPL